MVSSHPRFGDLLRQHRRARGLTQEQLAERTGLSVRGISDLERGARNIPYQETILRLIAGLELADPEHIELLAFARRGPRASSHSAAPWLRASTAGHPTAPGAFIGRAADVISVVRALHDPASRLVTLTGPPGVGKTRLAIEATQRLHALVARDVVFIDLAPVRTPDLVLPTIAATVGVRDAGSPELLDRLRGRLGAQPALVLLDNFEHVLAAAPVIADILDVSPGVRILVTSREALHLPGEQILTVPPLATPPLHAEMRVWDVVGHDAIDLFVARARQGNPAFSLTEENVRSVAGLCSRLDGLPLALELAAARVNHLSPSDILARLDEHRPVLTVGRPGLPERQRTLADAIDWSYDLLTQEEQRLFRRLSVFVGGFTPEAAGAVGGHHSAGALSALARKSLLTPQPGRVAGDRFTLLETIREYGLERLAASGDEAAVRKAHVTYFTSFAADVMRDIQGPAAHRTAIERAEEDHDNLRQALAWAAEQVDPLPLLWLTQSLWRFWWSRGHLSEGARWLQLALERSETAPPELRAKVLIAAGRLAWLRGALDVAMHHLQAALALDPGPFDRCEALNALGDVAREHRAFDRAEAALTEAIAIGRAREDWFHLGASLHNLGIVDLERGHYEQARSTLEEALVWARHVNAQYLTYSTLHYLSRIAFAQGDYARAAALRQEDLAVQRELAPLNAHGAARFCEGVALLALVQQQVTPAVTLFAVAARLRDDVENSEGAERERTAQWITTARELLGEAAFTQAWETGRARSLEAALDQAAGLLETWNWSATHEARGSRRGWSATPSSDSPSRQG